LQKVSPTSPLIVLVHTAVETRKATGIGRLMFYTGCGYVS